MSALNLRDERGFTLVELLVATLAGIVVSAALGAIVVVSGHFSSNIGDRVDANGQGRVAMEKITQALNSSCVASDVSPIVATGAGSTVSDNNNLIFYSSLADHATINPNELRVSLANGSLTMYTYNFSSGSAPNWTFSSTPATSFVLLEHAQAATVNLTAQPVFKYYGYAANGGGAISTTPYATPLSSANAAATAMVTISFQALPSDNYTATGRPVDITDSVALRLTPASSAANASNAPCT